MKIVVQMKGVCVCVFFTADSGTCIWKITVGQH
jgi:hypothetical protein